MRLIAGAMRFAPRNNKLLREWPTARESAGGETSAPPLRRSSAV
jgi:hypothetical protein